MIVQVAVSGPFKTALDYRVAANDAGRVIVGGRVRVPFRNREAIGVVTALLEQSAYEEGKLKTVIEVIDAEPLFTRQQLAFLNWASEYYHEPIGEVIQAALPKRLRIGDAPDTVRESVWSLTEKGRTIRAEDLPKNAKRQIELLAFFQTHPREQDANQLNQYLQNWRPTLKKFVQQGWLAERVGPCFSRSVHASKPEHQLNPEQQRAVDEVVSSLSTYQACLLEGVTGSGKTEVYLGMIESVLKQGKQVLVLVPEIGLTPQMVQRFTAALQQPVATLHSGLNDSERLCAWNSVRKGEVKVLLGTRSAVFTPFKNLGLCIIDEEHDLSFKQQEGFRYSARDLLIRLAYEQQIPVVLGSATPSLETLHNAQLGRFKHLKLTRRAANAELPQLRLLDIRGEKIQEGVSTPLQNAMRQHLQEGGQVLLFLNRRGYAPVMMCHQCGWQAQCPSCDANMTLHYSGRQYGHLRCHHCGYQCAAPAVCPSCQSNEFVQVGQGTERLEQIIQSWFEDYKVLRIDRDTTRIKGRMSELTEQARSGEADILIGTQMLAKGHHFPNVTLVGLLDVDQGLFGADFRASERMAQLILQVAGRAGRGEKRGEVLVQTHHPDHPLLITLVKHGYAAFAEKAIQERKVANLPPFSFQMLCRAEAHNPADAMNFLKVIKARLQLAEQVIVKAGDEASARRPVEIWGPVSAPMERRQGRYRYQLLIQAKLRSQLHELWAQIEEGIAADPLSRKVRWSLDVDPQEMN
ncbi:primosomal protein N' [Thiomicrorhabdus sp. zzn3]|uniref:primosomal protein N' n=1 Tax=Thiomicrorhabdus sp. zzn3 TaxID=3039775 RepID=UPI002436A931|nr:primosomal protein N' [Thiomicrorhabdus sp. zzn3]MDG6778886.1 primosomal protein N' [Thiomicrorhabdus sp. zzn3]